MSGGEKSNFWVYQIEHDNFDQARLGVGYVDD